MVVLPKSDFETLDVLYVAENLALAEMYRLKLELDGYWVRVVDLDSAVAEVRARRPDIVFLELPAGRPDRLGILDGSHGGRATSEPDLSYTNRLTNSSALSQTSRQPLSIVSE